MTRVLRTSSGVVSAAAVPPAMLPQTAASCAYRGFRSRYIDSRDLRNSYSGNWSDVKGILEVQVLNQLNIHTGCENPFVYLAHDSSPKTTIESWNTLMVQDKRCGFKRRCRSTIRRCLHPGFDDFCRNAYQTSSLTGKIFICGR